MFSITTARNSTSAEPYRSHVIPRLLPSRPMRDLGLKSKVRKRFQPTTTQVDPTKRPAGNKPDRDFTAEAPNRICVTDITYLATAAGWLYLAAVVDLFSRKVVAGRSVHRWRPSWSAMHCVMPSSIFGRMASSCGITRIAVANGLFRVMSLLRHRESPRPSWAVKTLITYRSVFGGAGQLRHH